MVALHHIKESKTIQLKMLKDVGMRALYLYEAARHSGDKASIYATRQGMRVGRGYTCYYCCMPSSLPVLLHIYCPHPYILQHFNYYIAHEYARYLRTHSAYAAIIDLHLHVNSSTLYLVYETGQGPW